MKIGTKIYYDKNKKGFGNIVLQLGDCEIGGINSTLKEDYEIFNKEFSGLSIDDIGLIVYEFGEWNIVSKDATSWYVDIEKEEVVFDYTPIPTPPQEPNKIDLLEEKISILEAENAELLLDSAMKDLKLQTIENDLADLTLEIAMGGM